MPQPKIAIDQTALLDAQIREMELKISTQEVEIKRLTESVEYEKKLRLAAEAALREANEKLPKKRKRRTKAEMEAERKEYSPVKSNGVKKASKADYVRSYTDYKKIYDELNNDNPRNAFAWVIGISFGVRVSDICFLRWRNLLNPDFTFRERVMMFEKKTSKLQNCLITEAVREEATKYLNTIHWKIELDDFIFLNPLTNSYVKPKRFYTIITEASKRAGITYHISTHSMRSTFSNIALCLDKTTIDMNAIAKMQALLNHSDARTTMRYLGTLREMLDRTREVVSDFILGKTDVDVLEAGIIGEHNIEDVMERLTELETKINSLN